MVLKSMMHLMMWVENSALHWRFLDKNNTGMILNAVHSRDNCFLYLKEIVKGGESYVVLSQEEVRSFRKAVNFGLGEI